MRTLAEVAQRVNNKIQNDFSEGNIYIAAQSVEFVARELFGERLQYLKRAIANCREANLLMNYEEVTVESVMGRTLAINTEEYYPLDECDESDWDRIDALRIFKIRKKKLQEPVPVGKGKKTISIRLDRIEVWEGMEHVTLDELVSTIAKRKYAKCQKDVDEFENRYCNTGLLTIQSVTHAYEFLEQLCGDVLIWNVINDRIKKGSDIEQKKLNFYREQIDALLKTHIADDKTRTRTVNKIFDVLTKKYV